jgi:hypothetical protein
MNKVKSLTFFQLWRDTVESRKEHLQKVWRNNAEFTLSIKGDGSKNDSVLAVIAEKLNLHCYPFEYYSLDSILYDENDMVPERPEGTYWFRDIRVAFEHENHFNSGLFKEVSHLLLINCDLRVLVTYPPNDYNEEKQLEYLHKIIAGSRQSKSISDDESFLIILGYENGFSWFGYVYKEENWEPI